MVNVNYSSSYNTAENLGVWLIVSLFLAVIGGLVLYFLFIKPDKKVENKALAWFKEFFNFHKMLIEDLLKTTYIVLAIFITLYSFALIAVNFLGFILTIVLGNVILRLVYEASLILIMIWKNTNDINKSLKK